MSEKDNFKKAMSLLMSGRRKEASAVLLPLYEQAANKNFKIQIIDALLSALDPIKDNPRLIDIASEGIEITKELGIADLQGHFMGRKADFLINKITNSWHQRSNLKLTPRWFEFSTEIDKINYQYLSEEIRAIEQEIDQLLFNALDLAKGAGDKKALAFVLMSKAGVESSRYLQYKADFMCGSWKIKLWLFLNKLGYEIPILFGVKYSKRLKAYTDSFVKYNLEAAKILEGINDEGAGYAYHNLALHLRCAYKFNEASIYLKKARVIAEKYKNALLLAQIKSLEDSIKTRNKDIPNYLEGEGREEVVV